MKKIPFKLLFCILCGLSISAQEDVNRNTTIFWDVSISMKDRDLEKDLSILDKVFQRTPDQEIQLVLFNIDALERSYSIKGGQWEALKKDLESVRYDGANDYSLLKGLAKHPNIYLFTDGNRIYESDFPDLPAKSFLINSSPFRDEEFLKRTALINRYRLMDFAAILPENIGSLKNTRTAEKNVVKGKVYIDNVPVPDVVIAVKGEAGGVRTVLDGSFSIEARPGDSLLVSSRSRNTYRYVPVEEGTQMNIFLDANVVSLEEVVLVEKRQEEAVETITGYGKENSEKIGYAVQSIDDKSITPIQTNVSQSVLNKFSNVNLGNTDDLSKATMRSNTSILGNNYSLVVIDGVPQRQSDSSQGASSSSQAVFDYINPDNIASISVLKGYAATNRYGSLGANGVILITSKSAAAAKTSGEPVDLARLRDNVYTGKDQQAQGTKSELLKILELSGNKEKAYEEYIRLRSDSDVGVGFFLDAYDYFKKDDPEKAGVIASGILELFPKDINALKAVSLALSGVNKYRDVIRINEEILEIDNKQAQAYLDIALARKGMGEYQQALQDLLALRNNTITPPVSTGSVSKTVLREIKNLVFLHKGALNTSVLPPELLNNLKYDVRLVFEWNDPQAEFDLQFVNPQNRYFNWEHNTLSATERMKDEILNGYSSEEFEFYGEGVQGKWILNATYLGHVDITNQVPLVLKCTLYQNFGYPDQTSKEIVLSFSAPNETKTIAEVLVD
ncbi:TonB-dependent outer membrane receptor, SusC/RagA subfamily, signature region [Muriicola jejuensis]|uniref:TonB-dependent receptor plug domain-containing protein n=1 Tax=Muriicola jejuensis TaxID=504488 RepID=A0A6P0UD04_9FLAO|nr:TonB-dependent receptor plug domain-containing protein [Muriicola jejuensis]NER11135.1 TonB-dependent receptor plug domain-containing protein [Muriicola jejuensis]SMP24003.1 TonB-dependent outer membrane receptor, SusC/RagA subfamily, signature region [Muriicola jejuensis]